TGSDADGTEGIASDEYLAHLPRRTERGVVQAPIWQTDPMEPVDPKDLLLDRSAFSVADLDDEDPGIEFWANASPENRLRHMELLRRINYGRRASARLQRVLSVAEL